MQASEAEWAVSVDYHYNAVSNRTVYTFEVEALDGGSSSCGSPDSLSVRWEAVLGSALYLFGGLLGSSSAGRCHTSPGMRRHVALPQPAWRPDDRCRPKQAHHSSALPLTGIAAGTERGIEHGIERGLWPDCVQAQRGSPRPGGGAAGGQVPQGLR
jgi:hypothetical protein